MSRTSRPSSAAKESRNGGLSDENSFNHPEPKSRGSRGSVGAGDSTISVNQVDGIDRVLMRTLPSANPLATPRPRMPTEGEGRGTVSPSNGVQAGSTDRQSPGGLEIW